MKIRTRILKIIAISLVLGSGIQLQAMDADSGKQTRDLITYALLGNLEKVRELVAEGANVNASSLNRTVLERAVASGKNLEVAKFLIERGAHVNLPNRDGETALMIAAGEKASRNGVEPIGTAQMCKLLIENGAHVDAQDQRGWTALHYAALNGHVKALQALLTTIPRSEALEMQKYKLIDQALIDRLVASQMLRVKLLILIQDRNNQTARNLAWDWHRLDTANMLDETNAAAREWRREQLEANIKRILLSDQEEEEAKQVQECSICYTEQKEQSIAPCCKQIICPACWHRSLAQMKGHCPFCRHKME